MITLTKITMVRPTAAHIYAPSRLTPARQMTEADFLAQYADSARSIPVSFEPDGVSNPQPVTAYANGFDAWWIIQ